MCHDGEGRYLMEYRSGECRDEGHTWSPVGSGALKMHETLEDAVRREVREECGAQAYGIEYLGHREVFREHTNGTTHWIAFDFRAQIDPADAYIREPNKCLEHRWCRLNEIPDPKHSQFPYFLEKYTHVL